MVTEFINFCLTLYGVASEMSLSYSCHVRLLVLHTLAFNMVSFRRLLYLKLFMVLHKS